MIDFSDEPKGDPDKVPEMKGHFKIGSHGLPLPWKKFQKRMQALEKVLQAQRLIAQVQEMLGPVAQGQLCKASYSLGEASGLIINQPPKIAYGPKTIGCVMVMQGAEGGYFYTVLRNVGDCANAKELTLFESKEFPNVEQALMDASLRCIGIQEGAL